MWFVVYYDPLFDINSVIRNEQRIAKVNDLTEIHIIEGNSEEFTDLPIHLFVVNRLPRRRLLLYYDARRVRRNPNYQIIQYETILRMKDTGQWLALERDPAMLWPGFYKQRRIGNTSRIEYPNFRQSTFLDGCNPRKQNVSYWVKTDSGRESREGFDYRWYPELPYCLNMRFLHYITTNRRPWRDTYDYYDDLLHTAWGSRCMPYCGNPYTCLFGHTDIVRESILPMSCKLPIRVVKFIIKNVELAFMYHTVFLYCPRPNFKYVTCIGPTPPRIILNIATSHAMGLTEELEKYRVRSGKPDYIPCVREY